MLSLPIVFFSFSREWWDHSQSTLQSEKTPHSWENESSRNGLRSGLCWTHTALLWGNRFWRRSWNRIRDVARLQVVHHFSSGIGERAKRERAWKSPHARKGEQSPCLAWVIYTRARVSLALLSLRKNGGLLADCTRSLALRTRTMKNWERRCKFKHKILVKKDFRRSKWSQKSISSTSQTE